MQVPMVDSRTGDTNCRPRTAGRPNPTALHASLPTRMHLRRQPRVFTPFRCVSIVRRWNDGITSVADGQPSATVASIFGSVELTIARYCWNAVISL